MSEKALRQNIMAIAETCRRLRSKLRKVTKAKLDLAKVAEDLQIDLMRFGDHLEECDIHANENLTPGYYMACDCGWAEVEIERHYATAAQKTKRAEAIAFTWEEV